MHLVMILLQITAMFVSRVSVSKLKMYFLSPSFPCPVHWGSASGPKGCSLRRVLVKRDVTPVTVVHRGPEGKHTKNSEAVSNTKEDMEVSVLSYLFLR